MSRHFHWQPSEIDDMPMDELMDYLKAGQTMLKAESE